MNTALIFVCSQNIDAYINAAAYLQDKREVTKFTFVFLVDAPTESPATHFVEEILSRLSMLAEGKYNGRPIDIDDSAKAQYALLAANLRSNPSLRQVTTLEELPGFLRRQAAAAKPGRIFIDTTGLTKNLLAHVFSIAIFYDYEAYTFELRERPNRSRPELSLYFHLRPTDFQYQLLTQEPTVQRIRKSLIPVSRILWITTTLFVVSIACLAAYLIMDQDNLLFMISVSPPTS